MVVELELFVRPRPSDDLLSTVSVGNINGQFNDLRERGRVINRIDIGISSLGGCPESLSLGSTLVGLKQQ